MSRHELREITWSDFTEQGHHQWVCDDDEFSARYSLRKVDNQVEASIRDKIRHNPTEQDIKNFLAAVNAYRRRRLIADEREVG